MRPNTEPAIGAADIGMLEVSVITLLHLDPADVLAAFLREHQVGMLLGCARDKPDMHTDDDDAERRKEVPAQKPEDMMPTA